MTAKPCCAVDPIENDDDRNKTVNSINSNLEKADRLYKQLVSSKPVLEVKKKINMMNFSNLRLNTYPIYRWLKSHITVFFSGAIHFLFLHYIMLSNQTIINKNNMTV